MLKFLFSSLIRENQKKKWYNQFKERDTFIDQEY